MLLGRSGARLPRTGHRPGAQGSPPPLPRRCPARGEVLVAVPPVMLGNAAAGECFCRRAWGRSADLLGSFCCLRCTILPTILVYTYIYINTFFTGLHGKTCFKLGFTLSGPSPLVSSPVWKTLVYPSGPEAAGNFPQRW